MNPTPKNPHAQALGRLGGSKNTPAQDKARALNARKGGWPKGRPRRINVMQTNKINCECSDPGCPVCKGKCASRANNVLVRVDMEDRTGTRFCSKCAADAMDSGLFRIDYKLQNNYKLYPK